MEGLESEEVFPLCYLAAPVAVGQGGAGKSACLSLLKRSGYKLRSASKGGLKSSVDG